DHGDPSRLHPRTQRRRRRLHHPTSARRSGFKNMLNQTPNSACGVLYIDDEEKALKYFRMAYSPDFKVFTASSGQEGIEILRRESKQIGVIISDQRMPEMVGAEVLEIARREFPMIVRILTTAYSDLDSAIQAVNKGHIYQYVVKPWDVDDLRMVL